MGVKANNGIAKSERITAWLQIFLVNLEQFFIVYWGRWRAGYININMYKGSGKMKYMVVIQFHINCAYKQIFHASILGQVLALTHHISIYIIYKIYNV